MIKRMPDNFFFGIAAAVVIAFIIYSVLCLAFSVPFFALERQFRWIYVAAFVPNFIIFRMALVNLQKRKTGEGMAFVTLIMVVLFLFLTK